MAGLKDSFSKGLTTINVKASNFMEQNKLKTYISTLEGDIEKLKTEIGRKSYQAWCADSFSQELILPELESIKEKYETIEKTKIDIAELEEKEKQILGNSAPENQQQAPQQFQPQYQQQASQQFQQQYQQQVPQQFQPQYQQQAPQQVPQQAPTANLLYCAKCGNPYKAGYKFCEKCGAKLD